MTTSTSTAALTRLAHRLTDRYSEHARHRSRIAGAEIASLLGAVHDAHELTIVAQELTDAAARRALAAGATYAEVATTLGLTRQAAHHRYGRD
jgi:hypothetical protein